MRITKVRALNVKFKIPDDKAYGMSRGLTNVRGSTIVIVETDSGLTGFGESWGAGSYMVQLINELSHHYINKDPFDRGIIIQEVMDKMYHMGRSGLHIAALSGIDIALWDLMGKATNQSIAKLLGGVNKRSIKAYASTGYLTSKSSLKELEREITLAKEKGFQAYKIKIGINPESDRERIDLTRKIVGEKGIIMVDANGNYKRDVAIQSVKAIEEYKPYWYEEPISPEDLDGFKYLKTQTTVPIAGGEALYTRHGFRDYLTKGFLDVAQPDLTKCGGFSEAKAIADIAEAFNLTISTHVWGTAIGFAAALQFMGSLSSHPHTLNEPNSMMFEFDQSRNPLIHEMTDEKIKFKNGQLGISDKPGLGMAFDKEKFMYAINRDESLYFEY